MTLTPPPRKERDLALDALRLIAVLLMIASHTTRLIVRDERRAWSSFALLIEPLTASLFLILVGASLVHSLRAAEGRGRRAWFRKQALRAAALWAVSCLFYTLEEGPRLPDALTMSGILATIAYVSLLAMGLVASPRPMAGLAAAAALGLGLHHWFDQKGIRIFALNAGNSPLLPLFPLACLGALGALSLERGRALRFGILAAAAVALSALLYRHGFAEIFSKPLGRYETARILEWIDKGQSQRREIPYYNLRPILVPMIAALVVWAYAFLALIRPALAAGGGKLLAMGRRSLDVYILHLAILAIFVVAGGLRPLHKTWQGDAVAAGIIAVCWIWAIARDRLAARRRSARSGPAST